MKTLILFGLAALVSGALAQSIPGRNLIWADEFSQSDGTLPDPTKWGYDIGGSGWGNNELQYYTNRSQNARVEAGQLIIEARAESYEGRNYTSARLLTKDKWAWTYGRIEARIKIPKGQGIWPAFWMLGTTIGTVGWPNCGEIDILENIGSLPSTLYGTVHGPGYSGGGGISGNTVLSGAALGDDFHVYAIEWEENRIRWFLDGQLFFTVTPASLPAGSTWVFNQPQFLILNVAVGGNWPGNPNGTTSFPQRMMVDYVRVYAPTSVAVTNTKVTVDPSESWIGYMHVSDLPANGGTYRDGKIWNVADLRASFSGTTLTLSPNTTSDPLTYWYIGGGAPGRPGNKIMTANMYVEKTGSLSGKTVTFSGKVTDHTLTSAHQTRAFIRDFSSNFSSSFSTVTAPLVKGEFSISLATSAGSGRHVQYGFETTGVNVWPTDAAPFGSIRITPLTETSFNAWMSTRDFSAFTNPNLSAEGDPDGDGESNFREFAFNSDPSSARNSGKVISRLDTTSGAQALVLSFPVRGNPTFTGTPQKSALADQVIYTVEGSNDLVNFNQIVTEITAESANLPSLESGWTYRSFRLAGEIGGSTSRGNSGFLRVRTALSP
jgi:beta-glucanase (GH16 family)